MPRRRETAPTAPVGRRRPQQRAFRARDGDHDVGDGTSAPPAGRRSRRRIAACARPSVISATFLNASTAARCSSRGPSPRAPARPGLRVSRPAACARPAISGSSPFTARANQHARDQQPVDLVRAFEDAVHARIAVVPLGGIVLHEPVAAVNLHVLVEHEIQRLAARDFRNRRLDGELFHAPRARHPGRRSARSTRR